MTCAANTFGSRTWSAPPDRRGGNSVGEQDPHVRCSPLASRACSVSRAPWRLAPAQPAVAKRLSGSQLRHSNTGGDLCRPLDAGSRAQRSLRGVWRERPRDLAAWPAKPAATEVVAHATMSLPQPQRVVVGLAHPSGVEGMQIHLVIIGRRAAIVRLATRALKALRASSVALRPRCARLATLTARAATRSLGNCRRPIHKCLTTCASGATF